MPKIIHNLEQKLIEEAKAQVIANGYGAVTIRSVAKACGVGVGTVYNYFSSKDELLASYLLTDWKRCVDAINAVSAYSDRPEPVVRCIYDHLVGYAERHKAVFRDEAAVSGFAVSAGSYHPMLRDQLAAPLRKFCKDDFAAQFIAEALLTWTMAGAEFSQLRGMIERLF